MNFVSKNLSCHGKPFSRILGFKVLRIRESSASENKGFGEGHFSLYMGLPLDFQDRVEGKYIRGLLTMVTKGTRHPIPDSDVTVWTSHASTRSNGREKK